METAIVLENFSIRYIAWHEVREKVNTWIVEDLLNEKLHLSKHGDGLHQILFTYIADYDKTAHPEEMEYDVDNKVLYLALRLDYEKVKNGTKEEVLIMMKDLFLTSVFYYYSVGVRDFDFRGFYEDLKTIL